MGAWAIAAAVVFGAALLRGMTGFGSALIIVPVLALLYGPVEAVLASIILDVFAGAYLLPQAWRATDWRLVAGMTAPTPPMIALGTLALTALDPALLKIFIGATSMSFALLLLGGRTWPLHRWRWSWPVAGAVSGFFTGTANMGGPPVMLLMANAFRQKAALRSNFIGFITPQFVIVCAVYAARGLVSVAGATLALSLLPLWLAGLWLGARLYHRAGSALFRRVTLVAVVLASTPAVVVSLVDLATRR
ncbi:MAG: sulfite exporter TauE/SafE family protein [Chloroflexi bacterium]|nr:sulfite exporter TauE/SafE family protein [Chloroflexota bacterium]MBI4507276.1 sulfite exporter TauE/SafE family protein [Chloroflexota bacterium]